MLCKLCEIKSHGSWWNINRQYKTSSLMHALRAFYVLSLHRQRVSACLYEVFIPKGNRSGLKQRFPKKVVVLQKGKLSWESQSKERAPKM